MRLLSRVRKLEAKSTLGLCPECGGPIRWLISIEELESIEERVARGDRMCGWCAWHLTTRVACMPKAILDTFHAKAEKA